MQNKKSYFIGVLVSFFVMACAPANGSDQEVKAEEVDSFATLSDIGADRVEEALQYLEAHESQFRNQRYITFFNARVHSGKKRFFVWDRQTDRVESYLVAHGKGSDSNHDGLATVFSNVSGSNASSLGFYHTDSTYNGGNGYSLKLDGLSSTNSNARSRLIVIHGAAYVNPNRSIMGRSWGCPALEQRYVRGVIDRIKGGSLLYIYY